jgi:carboxyl-terminal processing protease
VVILLVGQGVYASEISGDGSYLDSIMDFIRDEYYGEEITREDLTDSAIRGMFNSLDIYTTYYNNEEKDVFMDSITGTFGGIGVTMTISEDYIVVTDVLSPSPAEKAGIMQGDRIVEANGTKLLKATLEQAASVIKGEPGTTVKLGILRGGGSEIIYIDVIREIIKINPVSYENRNGIGYIKLDTFNDNTDEQMTNALKYFDKIGIDKIVLDLRDNPGGDVGQAVAVARKFVPEGLITKLDYKSPKYEDLEYYSSLKSPKYKLAVLVNEMSASASEIVSGAIQDTNAGKLVGTRTYGKAKFQAILPLLSEEAYIKYRDLYGLYTVNAMDLYYFGIYPDEDEIGGYAKMTLGVYYTPKGRLIDGSGLMPDIKASDPEPLDGLYINDIKRLSKTTELKLNSLGSDVFNAKKILKMMGYGVNTLDTSFDAELESVLKEYQAQNNIKASGVLDIKTQIFLNVDLLNLIMKYDGQYSAAVHYLNN